MPFFLLTGALSIHTHLGHVLRRSCSVMISQYLLQSQDLCLLWRSSYSENCFIRCKDTNVASDLTSLLMWMQGKEAFTATALNRSTVMSVSLSCKTEVAECKHEITMYHSLIVLMEYNIIIWCSFPNLIFWVSVLIICEFRKKKSFPLIKEYYLTVSVTIMEGEDCTFITIIKLCKLNVEIKY